MQAVISIFTLLLGVAIILAGNGLLGTLLGVRGQLEAFSSATLGFIMAAYFAGFVVGTFWVPKMIRRVGHIRMFAAMASIVSVTTLSHGLLVYPAAWMALRLISGVCIVGMYIAIESWLNEQTTNEQRGHVFSAYMTTTLMGLGVGQGLLLVGDAANLYLFALASVLLSLGLVPVALTEVKEPTIVEAARLGLRKIYAISPLGVVACMFAGVGSGAFWGLGPVFAAGIGLSTAGIAGFMGLTVLGGITMLWPVGRLSDRYPRRNVLMWVCVLTSLGAAGAMWLVAYWPEAVMLGGFAYGAFAFSIYSMAAAYTNDHLERSQMLEVTSSLQLIWGSGAIAGPILSGMLMARFGPETLLAFIAIAALAPGIFARYRIAVSETVPMEEQGEYLPQFATSPAAIEMYPEEEEPGDGREDTGDDEP